MALLDVNTASKYGLNSAWFRDFYASSGAGGRTYGQVNVDYTDGCASRNTWGQCRSGTKQRDVDARYDRNSSLSRTGVTVSGSQWLQNNSSTNAAANQMLEQAFENQPMTARSPVLTSGNRSNSSTRAGQPIYLPENQPFNPGGIQFVSRGAGVTLGSGPVMFSGAQLAESAGASTTFTFIPGAQQTLKLSQKNTNSINTSTTNGTSNSSGNSQTASLQITNTTKVWQNNRIPTAIPGVFVTKSSSVETTVRAGWSGTWDSKNSQNFSETSSTTSGEETSFDVTVPFGTAVQNSDGEYRYTYTASGPDGDSSGGLTFVPGRQYSISIVYLPTTVVNTIQGTYSIAGNPGTIRDNYGNVISLTAAEAIHYANARKGSQVLNYDASGIGSLSADRRSLAYTGTATAGTRINSLYTVVVTEVGDVSDALVSSTNQGALQKQSESSDRPYARFDLSRVDSDLDDPYGVSMQMATADNETATVVGTGSTDVVRASSNGVHTYKNFRDSIIYGNNQADTFILDDDDSGNSIHTFQGDDSVVTSSSQVAGLGKGNDQYVINGGRGHHITLGMGNDKVIINDVDNIEFDINDFDFAEDTILLASDLNTNLLTARFVQEDIGSEWSSFVEFAYAGDFIGRAHILDNRSGAVDDLQDVDKMLEIAFLNADRLDFAGVIQFMASAESLTAHQMYRKIILDTGLYHSDNLLGHDDWVQMDDVQKATVLQEGLSDLGSSMTVDELLAGMTPETSGLGDEFTMEFLSQNVLPFAGVEVNSL